MTDKEQRMEKKKPKPTLVYVDASEITGRVKIEVNAFFKGEKISQPHYLERLNKDGTLKKKGIVLISSLLTIGEAMESTKGEFRYSQVVNSENLQDRIVGLMNRCGIDNVVVSKQSFDGILLSACGFVIACDLQVKDAMHLELAKEVGAYFLTGEGGPKEKEKFERLKKAYNKTINRKGFYKLLGMS